MRRLAPILFLFASVLISTAASTNYFCVVCGQGPLTGKIWLSKWGAVCDDCYKLEDHCSLCGLPVRDGDGCIRTGDGRFICRFDKTNAVLDAAVAREVFADARRELVELYGGGFALNFPDVTVNLFDVDYWSEKGREDGLHKFGFSHTRKARNGDCTHEVVLLSGRLRTELAATAAHEYTHLWINENRPVDHVIDSDTTEAICELSAYKLMEARSQPEQMRRILANPYTHGAITNLVAIEKENRHDAGAGNGIGRARRAGAKSGDAVHECARAAAGDVEAGRADGGRRSAPRHRQRRVVRAGRDEKREAAKPDGASPLPRNPRRRCGAGSGRRGGTTHAETRRGKICAVIVFKN